MRPGTRHDFQRLTVDRVTHYQRVIHGEDERTIYRYALRDRNGRRFVYSGKYLGWKPGQLVAIRATIKRAADQYGFIRLARIRIIALEPAPML